MSFCVAGAMDRAPCQKFAEPGGSVAVSSTTTATLHYIPLHYTATTTTELHYTTLDCLYDTTLHGTNYTALHCTTLHYLLDTTLNYATQRNATLHYTAQHKLQLQPRLQLHYIHHTTQLNYTRLHHTSRHYTQIYGPTRCTTLITLHCAALNYSRGHWNHNSEYN